MKVPPSYKISPRSQIIAFSHCLDFVLALSNDLPNILGRQIPKLTFTDSKCLFDAISKLTSISEKRPLIDKGAIHIPFNFCKIAHVSSKRNIANIFTKNKSEI